MKNELVHSNIINTSVRASRTGVYSVGDISNVHYHDELELLLVLEGEMICTSCDKEYVAKEGEVIFINSRVPHSTSAKIPTRYGLLQFREGDFCDNEITKVIKYSLRFQSQTSYPVKIFSNSDLADAIENILAEAENRQKSYEIFIKSGIYRILGILYRENVLSDAERVYNTRAVQTVIPVLIHINNNYAENLTLESVSAEIGFDHSYFCRIFKKATGATFTEYLNFVRICKAEKLLLKTQDSVLSISEAVGFSSLSYFNRTFKKYRNCSPRVYRTVVCDNV